MYLKVKQFFADNRKRAVNFSRIAIVCVVKFPRRHVHKRVVAAENILSQAIQYGFLTFQVP